MDKRNDRANEALRRSTAPKLTIERPVVQNPEARALNAFMRRQGSLGQGSLGHPRRGDDQY